MATAAMYKGRAIVAYRGDDALDSEGKVIDGAPKPPKDTDPSQQPGALGAPSPEERMAIAIAQAITNPKAMAAKGGAMSTSVARKDATAEAGEVLPAPADRVAGSESSPEKPASTRGGRRAKKP